MGDRTVTGSPVHEDPMSADRRTLVIGAAAMVVLVAVGVVSAQLFARGGCASLPSAVAVDGAEDRAPDAVLDGVFGGAGVQPSQLVGGLQDLLGGVVTDAVAVGEAAHLAPAGDGLVVAGPRTTALDPGAVPTGAIELGDRDVVAGNGRTVFVLTLANELTGQTDAIVPAAADDLRLGACMDTAVVGAPFAFHLDADDGELLLLRVDDDGEHAEAELRTPESGRTWSTPLDLGLGAPGTLAERLTGRLGDDSVLLARRAGPADDGPALVELARQDGALRGELAARTLAAAADLEPGRAVRFEVVAVGHDVAFVTASYDDDRGDGALRLLTVELDLVTAVGVVPLTGTLLDAATDDDRLVLVTATDDGQHEVVVVDPDGTRGASLSRTGPTGPASVGWWDDQVLVAMAGELLLAPAQDSGSVAGLDLQGLVVRDLAVLDGGRLALLLGHADTEDTVVVLLEPAPERAGASGQG